MTERILVVEDEADLAAIMADYLRAADYQVDVQGNGKSALEALQRQLPDLVVLDIMLPELDGISICRAVRRFSDVPIIMVTAKVQEIDRLLGLEVGADDYLCKPFSPKELVARVKAILRRSRKTSASASLIQIDEAKRRVSIGSEALSLTASEYCLFVAMAKRPGQIFSRQQLLDLLSRDNADVADRAIDSHIKNLRHKLAKHYPDTDFIHSVYGIGYRVEL